MCITPPTVPECMWTLQLLNQWQRFAFISAINELLAESWSCKFLVIGPIYVTVTLVICWPTEESLLNLNLCWCDFMMTHWHYKVNDSDRHVTTRVQHCGNMSGQTFRRAANKQSTPLWMYFTFRKLYYGTRQQMMWLELFFISYIVVMNSLILICICVNCLVSLCLLFGILLERSLFLLSRES